MRMRNTRSMKAARVAVAAGALFTAAPFVASQSAGAVEQGMAAAPWRIGFGDVVQKVRPAVFSISVKVVEETHGRAKPRHGASVGSGFFISPDGYAVADAHVVRPEHATALRLVGAAKARRRPMTRSMWAT
jgi:S1-C subfamily serine protease